MTNTTSSDSTLPRIERISEEMFELLGELGVSMSDLLKYAKKRGMKIIPPTLQLVKEAKESNE